MATHDRMDLNVRSQAFYHDFSPYLKKSHEDWYIKDASHKYLGASATFASRFFPSGIVSVIGLEDSSIPAITAHDINIMYAFENKVRQAKKEITIFSCGYFSDIDGGNCFILKMVPYLYQGRESVLVDVIDIACHSYIYELIPSIFTGEQVVISNVSLDNFKNFNPLNKVTSKEWEVAWLIICGYSSRWIVNYLDLSKKTVQSKIKNIYQKLQVFDQCGLLRVARFYGWIRFVPEKFSSSAVILKVE